MKNKQLTDFELTEIQNKCRAEDAPSAKSNKTNQDFAKEEANQ